MIYVLVRSKWNEISIESLIAIETATAIYQYLN